jgi:hypothetical protein
MAKKTVSYSDLIPRRLGYTPRYGYERLQREGAQIMNYSLDPHHDINHVDRMLKNFALLVESRELEYLNQDIIISSIIWHDVWKAQQKPNSSLFKNLFAAFWDGYGSSKMFQEHRDRYHISSAELDRIYYCIRHHHRMDRVVPFSISGWVERKPTVELKVLRDLDALETLGLEMFESWKRHVKPQLEENPFLVMAWRIVWNKGISRVKRDYFYTDWAWKRYKKHKELYENRAEVFMEMYV